MAEYNKLGGGRIKEKTLESLKKNVPLYASYEEFIRDALEDKIH